MLVLTRRVGESICIDGGIDIPALRVDGNHIRIGIKAPPHVRVLRKELLERREDLDPPLESTSAAA